MDNISEALKDAMLNYQKLKMLDIASDRGLQYLQNRNSNKMLEEERALSILEKKRRLGLPETSEDYERATNEGKSFYSMIAPSLGKRGIQAIPGPFSLGRKANHPSLLSKPSPSIAVSASDLIPSLKLLQNLGGLRYGGRIGRIATAFGL
jgi:hypothetical protein